MLVILAVWLEKSIMKGSRYCNMRQIPRRTLADVFIIRLQNYNVTQQNKEFAYRKSNEMKSAKSFNLISLNYRVVLCWFIQFELTDV